MAGKIRYTEEEVLKQMQDHYKRHEKMTRKFFGEDKKVCSSGVVFIRFGSWEKALEEAGISLKKLTKENMLEQLKDYYERNGEITRRAFGRDRGVCSSSVIGVPPTFRKFCTLSYIFI